VSRSIERTLHVCRSIAPCKNPVNVIELAGSEADRSSVEYSLAGTEAQKTFGTMAALGIIAFTFGALVFGCSNSLLRLRLLLDPEMCMMHRDDSLSHDAV
jgi:hypothetical protein